MTYIVPVVVELYLGGTWVDITAPKHVQKRNLITITRGRSGESSQVEHSNASLSLDNTDGRYSPRNPLSPYYGQLGRNVPLRIALTQGTTYLNLPGTSGAQAAAPDTASLSITGDIDVRIEVMLSNWRASVDLCGKYKATGNQRSWALYLNSDGTLSFAWSAAGTTVLTRTSTVPVPAPGSARQAVAATLDVNNGAAGHTVTFWTAATISGTWTQLGDAVTTAGTTSIFDSTAPVEVGDVADLTGGAIVGRVRRFELRNGIGGTVVANPNFTIQTASATSFADTASPANTWTVASGATLSNRRYRLHGEVSTFPTRSDRSGKDVYVPIEANGVLRRLSQGSQVLRSALYRGMIFDTAALVAYWPLEDAAGSTSLAAALATHGPMTIIGTPTLASYESFAASAPIPVLAGAEFRGPVPHYTDTGQTQIRWIMNVPAAGAENGQSLMLWYGTGSVRRWDVVYSTGGDLRLNATDGNGVLVDFTGNIAFGVNGKNVMVSVELTQSGADIAITISTLEPGASAVTTFSTTFAGLTVGRVGTVIVSNGGGVASVAVGHVSVQNSITALAGLSAQLAAWAGETAGRRIERLCRESGIGFAARGDLDDTVPLGVQLRADLLALIREAADTDAGILFEPVDLLGLGYRTRTSLYNQDPVLALSYTALGDALDPVDDDQLTRNDITVERPGGSSARAVQETGPLSILPPPNGVGTGYDDQVAVNVRYDLMLFDQATWRLHVGTVDESRFPQIPLNMIVNAISSNPVLSEAVLELEAGDRITIDDLPSWLPPDTISQLLIGVAETLGGTTHAIRLAAAPESPYQVAVYGTARYGPHDTVTNEALDATETGVDITTPTGPLWSTSPGGTFDIVIGGEQMTVTAVGAASGTVQTLTVVRSVNGVVKTHSSGAMVAMATPAIYAL